MTVRDIDRGWKRIRRQLPKFNGAAVLVGIQSDEAPRDDGTSMALVAAVNEFGTEDGHIPERSFLRSTVDDNRTRYYRLARELHSDVLRGRFGIWRALSLVGQKAQADVQAKIASGVPPPNAPSTIERKGSSTPLIDTGAMRQAIRYVVEGVDRND